MWEHINVSDFLIGVIGVAIALIPIIIIIWFLVYIGFYR